MKQLVSILIPAFNAERWIDKCIESAVAQTWPRKEIIVVDDGSTDATFRIASSVSSSLVQVRKQENQGASAARNHALSLAQGDYIQWLDADDVLAPDKIERQLEGSEGGRSSRILLSGAWGKFYGRPERAKFSPDFLWEDMKASEWMYRKVEYGLWMAIESWLVSRRLTEMVGPWNESLSLAIDGEYFNRVLSISERVRFFPEARVFVRRGNVGISSKLSLNDEKVDSLALVAFSSIKTLMSMENSERTRDACVKHLQRASVNFYGNRPEIWTQMELMAQRLGGELETPSLAGGYRWLQRLLGFRFAKKAQRTLPSLHSLVERNRERFAVKKY
jgi:glycosyltransferase involved in cell wall biosynthesis